MKPRPCRILVIDDVPALTKLLAFFLSRRGYEVQTVNDSRTAIQTALDFHPEVVLLDITMPYLDGYEVARLIHQEPHMESLPIVAITSHDDDSHHEQAAKVGIGHSFTKPCSLPELETMIRHYCA